jgi:cobalt-zinc-cadmium efflux system outer membrane protein
LWLAGAASGCAAVDPAPRFAELGELVRAPTGETLAWERDAADVERTRGAVADLLAGGLSRAEAGRIALLNNRALQAAFEEIGVAEAQRVQAALWSNPSLGVILAFPADLGDSSATLLGLLSDAWNAPVKEAIAERALAAKVRHVAATVVETAAAAASAYDAVLAWTARRDVEAELASLQAEQLARVRGRRGESPLSVFEAEGAALEQDLALASAEKELASARSSLATALGLDPAALPALIDALDLPPPRERDAKSAVEFALAHRFDVAAAAIAVEGAAEAVELEHRRFFGDVAVGPAYNGGFGVFDAGGPAVGVTLPLFDQNQAQIARAEYDLRRKQKLLDDARLRARDEVLGALGEADFRRRRAEAFAARSARAGELADAELAAATRLDRAERAAARRLVLKARRTAIESSAELRKAEIGLHRALWGAPPE